MAVGRNRSADGNWLYDRVFCVSDRYCVYNGNNRNWFCFRVHGGCAVSRYGGLFGEKDKKRIWRSVLFARIKGLQKGENR